MIHFISGAGSGHPDLINTVNAIARWQGNSKPVVRFFKILFFKHQRFIVRFDFRTINYYVSLVSFGKCVHLVCDVLSKLTIPVILYYDHALTLSMEIQRFWIRRFTWATLFFFINRYLAFLGHIPVIIQVFWSPSNLSHKFTVSIHSSVEEICTIKRISGRRQSNFLLTDWKVLHLHLNPSCRLLQSYHQYFVVAIQFIVGGQLPRILPATLLTDFGRSSFDYACLRNVWPQKMGYLVIHHYCVNWYRCRMCECTHATLHSPNNLVNYQWGIISNEPTAVSPFARAAQGCSEPLGREQWVSPRIPEASQSYLLY